ncbi:MAG: DUF1501 domain-containing protein [Planctomycetes bacterium]|nr:DUF1501 domain-containing protein [Planctomycetota bacterium]
MGGAAAARRGWLAGLGPVALAALAAADGRGDDGPAIDPLRPLAPRRPHFTPRATRVIFLFMVGGPSQVDTFDHKPALQALDGQPLPGSLRAAIAGSRFANVLHGCTDRLLASPYRWQRHGESGMWVSELFPAVARHVDRLCFIHSLQADSNNHAPASYQAHTGDIRAGKASLGAWTTYGLGSESADLPGYVVLFDAGPLGGAANYSHGFLPAAFQPTRLRDTGAPLPDLAPPEEFAAGQRDTLDLIRRLGIRHARQRPGLTELEARLASYELAYRMQSSALELGDVEAETPATLRAYGLDHADERTRAFGRKCLLARRLVERGVRFVQLYDMPDKDGWDAHALLADNHTPRARWTDQPIAALVSDLAARGLLDETLVVWASEFGRTPLVQGNGGRNHNAAGFTVWLAGGGVRPGQRIGATDELGYMAIERPTPFADLHATILAALGLSNDRLSFRAAGRDERLTGVAGSATVIPGVLG